MSYQTNGGSWVEVQVTGTSYWFANLADGDNTVRISACTHSGGCSDARAYSVLVGSTVADAPAPAAKPDVSALVTSSELVGTTGGSFRVDESGAATYQIPVFTPPGTAGVQPSISLNYSSQAGNGVAGMGWSIGGLSSITRCRQTLHQDDVAKAITLTNQDRACVDGQRLILQTGSYWGTGSTYKTEIDDYALYTFEGGYFKAEHKDGSTRYYGKDESQSGAKFRLDNKVLSWAISEIRDSANNPIKFVYADTSEGVNIEKIYYGFGSNRSAWSSQTYIEFDYELGRQDKATHYLAGHSYTVNGRLLNHIKVFSENSDGNSEEVRQYTLTYKPIAANALSKLEHLASVDECLGLGQRCLPPVEFSWADPEDLTTEEIEVVIGGAEIPTDTYGIAIPGYGSSFTLTESYNSYGFGGESQGIYELGYQTVSFLPIDLNGDAHQDLVWLEYYISGTTIKHRVKYAVSNGVQLVAAEYDNNSAWIEFNDDHPDKLKLAVLDYNADGRQDLAVYSQSADHWKIYLSKPQPDGSWRLASAAVAQVAAPKTAKFVDIDGDGLVDLTWRYGLANPQVSKLERDQGKPITSDNYYHFASEAPLINDFRDQDFPFFRDYLAQTMTATELENHMRQILIESGAPPEYQDPALFPPSLSIFDYGYDLTGNGQMTDANYDCGRCECVKFTMQQRRIHLLASMWLSQNYFVLIMLLIQCRPVCGRKALQILPFSIKI